MSADPTSATLAAARMLRTLARDLEDAELAMLKASAARAALTKAQDAFRAAQKALYYDAPPGGIILALLDEVERLRALVTPVAAAPEPRKVVIWHHRKDDEELPGGDDLDEAIYNAIHAAAWGMCGELKRPDMLEETITVYGFARMQPTLAAWRYLESAIEDLDEEHGSPDGPFEATPAMVAASETFARTMEREYVSWACDVVETRVVNVREWCAAHRPDWLAQLPAAEPDEGGTP